MGCPSCFSVVSRDSRHFALILAGTSNRLLWILIWSDTYRIYQAFASCSLQRQPWFKSAICVPAGTTTKKKPSCNAYLCQIRGHCRLAHLANWTLIPGQKPVYFFYFLFLFWSNMGKLLPQTNRSRPKSVRSLEGLGAVTHTYED